VSSQNFSSKALQRGPVVIQPDLKQETTLSVSLSPIDARLKGKKSFLISMRHSPNLDSGLTSESRKTRYSVPTEDLYGETPPS